MSDSNKQAKVPLLTEAELQRTSQQHDMPCADDWARQPFLSNESAFSDVAGTEMSLLSTDHAVSRSMIGNAQFDVGIDMIKVRMQAQSLKAIPPGIERSETVSISSFMPRLFINNKTPGEPGGAYVERTRSIDLTIFEVPVRVTMTSVDGIDGISIFCEFNPSHIHEVQRIRPATIEETHKALEALDDFLRPFLIGLHPRLAWNLYRLDLAVDFTPDGPTHEIHAMALPSFRRGRSKVEQYFGKKNIVETTECRSKKAGSLKLYDKRRQMKAVHNIDIEKDLMRIEYQMKRPALRDKMRTVGDLTRAMAHATMESRIKFFSKRLQPKVAATIVVIVGEEVKYA